MLSVPNIKIDEKVTDLNLDIHANSNCFTSHHKNSHLPCDTSSSSFEIRQTFAHFLQGLGRNISPKN
jgi:hypothetical protein